MLKLAAAHLHVSFYSGDEPAVSPLLRYSHNQAHLPRIFKVLPLCPLAFVFGGLLSDVCEFDVFFSQIGMGVEILGL